MPGLLLIASAVASSVLFAAAARIPSPVSTLLAAYLAFVANIGVVTLALSPFHEVTRSGLAVAEAAILAGSAGVWWVRGRPGLPVGAGWAAARDILRDPPTAVFALVVGALLGYELLLALAVPPNNGDALAYHLPKAAAWAQHGGIYWIPDAPTVRLNEFQPFAEQQLLFLFVATGGSALIAIPQFVAELAILVAVFGAARRLGFGTRAAACGGFLFATFSLVALEATTAQNDLVAASFPAVACCLLLGGGGLEAALAGAAVGMGVGVKLTTALVLPVLAWLALARGRRIAVLAAAGGAAGLAAIGVWGYVLNAVHTGHVFGVGTGPVEYRASPAYPRSLANAFDLAYGLMDGSILSSRLIHLLALAGVVAALGAGAWALRRVGRRRAAADAAGVALPFVAPLLVIGGAGAIAWVAGKWGFPLRGSNGILTPLEENLNEEYGRISNEDYSAFGPVGIVALIAATVLAVVAYVTRRADVRQLALACAIPSFLVLVALDTVWNPFLIRFFLVPAVLAAPLLAWLFSSRLVTVAFVVAAGLTVGLTITKDQTKPLDNPYGHGRPWNLTQENSIGVNANPTFAVAAGLLPQYLPAHACVGAIDDVWEPTYLLFGPGLQHRVTYLPRDASAVAQAAETGLSYVAISSGTYASVADSFAAAGWKLQPIGGWILASHPKAGDGICPS